MTFYVENETDMEFDFSAKEVARLALEAVLEEEGCPYEAQVNLLITDNAGIRRLNKEHRNMDRPTDVLSFPNLDFLSPADFSGAEESEADFFDPESGELLLGDIVISGEKVREQAESYGHSEKREFAFLTVHSMLHLCGYDHMEEAQAAVMEEKQRQILRRVGIARD